MEPFTYLLKIDFDGEVHGYSNRSAQLVDGIAFLSGLTSLSIPGISAPLFGFGGGGGNLSFSIALEQTDILNLQSVGVRLQRSGVRCWAWLPNQTLAQAVEVFRGEILAPSFDLNNGIFSATAGAPAFTSDAPFPPALIDDEGRFASLTDDLPESSLRLAVPIIYGTVLDSPLIPLEPDPGLGIRARFLVAGHPIVSSSLTIAVDGVTIAAPVFPTTVLTAIDDLGNPYSYIEVDGADYDENIYAESISGKPAPDGRAIEKLGDVLIDMWLSFGRGEFFDLDRKRVYGSRPRLNRYLVGALWNSRTQGQTLIDALNTRFAQQYPVVFGPVNGQYGWDATFVPTDAEPPVLTLIYGQNVHFRGTVSLTDAAQVRNIFNLAFANSPFQGSTTLSQTLDKNNDGVCRGSVSRWGQSPLHSWNAGDVPDAGTAYTLLSDEARRLSEVRWQVVYGLADPTTMQLPLFGIVLVTDDDLGFSEKKFLIESLTPRMDGRVDIGLIEL